MLLKKTDGLNEEVVDAFNNLCLPLKIKATSKMVSEMACISLAIGFKCSLSDSNARENQIRARWHSPNSWE